ncbi:MAG: hypothetical protein IJ938_00990 [Clostridia bacterium]|nr:hypothetical protein [Clostridia bacterium]MBR2159868.1 hypothetical protein [Clostridia bacterium]
MATIIFDKFETLFISGVFIPKFVREMEIESIYPFSVFGASLDFSFVSGQVDLKGKKVKGNLSAAFTDKIHISPKSVKSTKNLLKTFDCFGFNVGAYFLQGKDCNKVILESDKNFIEIECERFNKLDSVDNFALLNCDSRLYVIAFDGDYKIVHNFPCDSFSVENSLLSAVYCPLTTEGIVINRQLLFSGNSFTQKEELTFLSEGNYNQNTLPVALFERLQYCNSEKILALLSDDFTIDDVDRLKKYVGKFNDFSFDGERICTPSGIFEVKIKENKVFDLVKL